MTPFETALARSRTYGLIAEVLLEGWTPRAVAVVDGLPWSGAIPGDDDQRAVRYQRVFGRSVPPYESVFRSADGLLGGPVAGSVREAYDRMGFRVSRTDVEPDHAGLQCAALSFLCGAEADARRDGLAAERFVTLQQEFVCGHLGTWVDVLHTAVSRQGVPELTELTALLVDLVHEHADVTRDSGHGEDLLADPKTGLKDVAAYLLVPARCGMWLGTDDIQRVAERAGLACGFGRRIQMMESLMFSAVDHEALPALVASLNVELDAWDSPSPDSGDARVGATRAMLARLDSGGVMQFWDARYGEDGFAYGLEPNDFLKERAGLLKGDVLCLAEGEGRNATFLASRGITAHAMDASAVGVAKTLALAAERGVTVHAEQGDLATYDLGEARWDGIVSVFAHLPPPLRRRVHGAVARALRPGGVFLMEAYTPRQLAFGTGGPPVAEMLYEPDAIRAELVGLELEHFAELEREVHEGKYHGGRSAVLQVVARKPVSAR